MNSADLLIQTSAAEDTKSGEHGRAHVHFSSNATDVTGHIPVQSSRLQEAIASEDSGTSALQTQSLFDGGIAPTGAPSQSGHNSDCADRLSRAEQKCEMLLGLLKEEQQLKQSQSVRLAEVEHELFENATGYELQVRTQCSSTQTFQFLQDRPFLQDRQFEDRRH